MEPSQPRRGERVGGDDAGAQNRRIARRVPCSAAGDWLARFKARRAARRSGSSERRPPCRMTGSVHQPSADSPSMRCLAERLRRAPDRLDPPRVSRPRHRLERTRPSAPPARRLRLRPPVAHAPLARRRFPARPRRRDPDGSAHRGRSPRQRPPSSRRAAGGSTSRRRSGRFADRSPPISACHRSPEQVLTSKRNEGRRRPIPSDPPSCAGPGRSGR